MIASRIRKLRAQWLERLPRPVRRWRYRRAIDRALSKPHPPVVVYTMGKVASSAVASAVRRRGLSVFHVHSMNCESLRRLRQYLQARGLRHVATAMEDNGLTLFANLIAPGHRARIVTLVREPIGRNMSAYFQSLDVYLQTKRAHRAVSMERLVAEFPGRLERRTVLDWFDQEFKPVLGIDVYAQPFPWDRGYLRIDTDRYDVLIMRHDLSDDLKGQCLGDLIGEAPLPVERRNMAASKQYADAYQEFRRRARLPLEYVDEMLTAKYTRHFFSPEEILEVRRRWEPSAEVSAGNGLASE